MNDFASAQRIVCHFSCGAASAVATKLTLTDHADANVLIVNAFIEEEHPDNRRFAEDCERWFGRSITVLRDEKYGASTLECWKRKRYIKGAYAAPCSFELKRNLLDRFAVPNDIHVLGYTIEETDRYDAFLDANNGMKIQVPLIERNLSKADCLALLSVQVLNSRRCTGWAMTTRTASDARKAATVTGTRSAVTSQIGSIRLQTFRKPSDREPTSYATGAPESASG